jgi:hypothetical protein
VDGGECGDEVELGVDLDVDSDTGGVVREGRGICVI